MRARSGILGLTLAMAAAGAAMAEPALLADAELAEVRGGLMTPIGLDVGFAADIRTYVDGDLALETRLVWTDTGPVTDNSGPLATTATGLGDWSAAIAGRGGSTEILHDISSDRIVAVVLNTASDRSIRQDADITLTVPQLAVLENQVAAARLAQALSTAVNLGLVRSGGR
jgi:hypothetical protein